MMKTLCKVYTMRKMKCLIYIAVLLVSSGIHAKEIVNLRKFERKNIFQYSQMPDSLNTSSNVVNLYLIREFIAWKKTIIDEEYFPADDYVKSKVLLYDADGKFLKKDVAVLKYTVDGVGYIIAQTGGSNRQLWIYVQDSLQKKFTNKEEAKEAVNNLLMSIIKEDYRCYIPEIKPLVENCLLLGVQTEMFTGVPKGDFRKINKNYVQYGVTDSQIGIVLQKQVFVGTQRAHRPEPDQWFEFCKRCIKKTQSDDIDKPKSKYMQGLEKRMKKMTLKVKPLEQK